MELKVSESRVKQAHSESCDQMKKALECLFPETLRSKPKDEVVGRVEYLFFPSGDEVVRFVDRLECIKEKTIFTVCNEEGRVLISGIPEELFNCATWRLTNTALFFFKALQVACRYADEAFTYRRLVTELAKLEPK